VDCPNAGCIRGDFDLSDQLAKAVKEHRTTVTAEMCCQGWQSKTTIDTVLATTSCATRSAWVIEYMRSLSFARY